MDLILFAIDFILHVDVHLKELFENYGVWVYAILFLIIFCETGLVVTPFLPGDSLLFAAGALTVGSVLDVHTLAAVLIIAAVLGNVVNYTIGHFAYLCAVRGRDGGHDLSALPGVQPGWRPAVGTLLRRYLPVAHGDWCGQGQDGYCQGIIRNTVNQNEKGEP